MTIIDDSHRLFMEIEKLTKQCRELTDELNAAAKEIELHGDQRNKDTDAHQG